MHEELVALEELQALDLKLLKYRDELTEVPKNLEAMREDVAHVGELLKREQTRLEEAEEWRGSREKEIVIHNELLAKAKSKLMASRNEKENKAAQREIDALRKTIQEREEETLKIMEATEQYRVAIKAHTAEFAELEKQLQASEEEGKARLIEAHNMIEQHEAERRRLTERVPDKIRRLYERIHQRLGRAVVEVVDGHCLGCNMDLSPQMYIEVQRGDTIHQCPTCHRLLMFKPQTDQSDSS